MGFDEIAMSLDSLCESDYAMYSVGDIPPDRLIIHVQLPGALKNVYYVLREAFPVHARSNERSAALWWSSNGRPKAPEAWENIGRGRDLFVSKWGRFDISFAYTQFQAESNSAFP